MKGVRRYGGIIGHKGNWGFGMRSARTVRGLTVVEVLIALAIVSILASIALPKYQDYRERVRVAQAITDIRVINAAVHAHMLDNKAPPSSLTGFPAANKLDPWGRPYEYLKIFGDKSATGKARKNKSLVPINSYFDLYSKGKDGMSAGPLTSGPSRDDVVLANDGKFVGLAADYE
jgi:general secretion pathway protein G